MEAHIIGIADFANLGLNGTINIIGMFNRLFSKEFPAIRSPAYLPTRITSGWDEPDREYLVSIVLLGKDGVENWRSDSQISLSRAAQIYPIFTTNTLVFSHPGLYEFRLLINGESKSSLALEVVTIEEDNA